jgi:RNA 3'-terminal phosphate cyclase (ATP)
VIVIDGSEGEGGGQVLRTALSLSLVTSQPFRIERIRGRRARPGLLRQHLAAVEAAQRLGNARVTGATLGSATLEFVPGRIVPTDRCIDIGSAGSTTLVAQTLLPALLRAERPARIVIAGGTHNLLAPPVEFLARAFLPLLRRMGARVDVELNRAGYFPRGGGEMVLVVMPSPRLDPLHLPARGALASAACEVRLARLPRHIAEREVATVGATLGVPDVEVTILEDHDSPGPGNVVLVTLTCEHVTEVFAGFGRRGVPAEQVAREASEAARAWLAADVAVGVHLADQLLLPLALAGGGSFTTVTPTGHTHTNAQLIERFLPVRFRFDELGSGRWRIRLASV